MAAGPSGPRRARIFLVDDHALLRKGVKVTLAATDDLTVCGEAETAAEAPRRLSTARPDLVIVDLSMPGVGGMDLIRDLRERHPALPIVVLSLHDEKLYAERALRAGAQGYVMKQDPPERLLEAIRSALRGAVFVSEPLQANLLSTFLAPAARGASRRGLARLSPRERQVFRAIGRGLTTAQVAARYRLSPKTVETYRAHLRRKLGLADGNGLIHAAVRWAESEAADKPGH